MTLKEVLLTHKPFTRPHWEDKSICYYAPGTGPFKTLVTCDYFVVYESGCEPFFSTSLDLYGDEILAEDYELSRV